MPHPTSEIVAFAKHIDTFESQIFAYNLKTKEIKPISPVLPAVDNIKWDKIGE
ncbi:MAG: hypothetical protein JG781_1123 [Peptococcaceae bacterium]|jgi:hypothetical protein|nr:hypothetical protein [Peptococcaceae bacterium]